MVLYADMCYSRHEYTHSLTNKQTNKQSYQLTNSYLTVTLTSIIPLHNPVQELVLARFGRWTQILTLLDQQDSLPPPESTLPPYCRLVRIYARCLAVLHIRSVKQVAIHLQLLREVALDVPPDVLPASHAFFPHHQQLAQMYVHIAYASYHAMTQEFTQATEHLESAWAIQHSFGFMEPEPFYLPIDECMGALYLRIADTVGYAYAADELAKAKLYFENGLLKRPDNIWAKTGIYLTKDENALKDLIQSNLEYFRNKGDSWQDVRGPCCELGLC